MGETQYIQATYSKMTIKFNKAEHMLANVASVAALLRWIALDISGVPNKVETQCLPQSFPLKLHKVSMGHSD